MAVHLGHLFDLSLVGSADAPGLEIDAPDGGIRTLTFGDLSARAGRMTSVLQHRGIGRGDRVAVYLPNSLMFLEVFLATLRCGAVFTPINALYREREVAHIVADAAPGIIVARRDARHFFGPEAPVVAAEDLSDEAAGAPIAPASAHIDGDDPALIIYTSGTTGRSKGAVLTHNNVLANTVSIVTAWRITDRDRYLSVLPLFHVHGLANGVCSWLATGCRMRLCERFDRDRAPEVFDAFQPTLFFGVPTIYVRLLGLDLSLARRIGERMRLFVSGSAPLAPQLFEDFRVRFGHTILERYGMSETLMLMSNPYAGERRAGAVGQPLPGVSVRLVDDEGRDVADGQPGMILVRGSNVFGGYWRNPGATEAAFDGGWFRTGDIGQRFPDGYYALRGRASDLIISGGYNIYPREIEDVLLQCPGVREAAVIGRADAVRGEVPVAYVVAADSFERDAVEAHCARMLASFKVPRAFIKVEALPRNALGKLQKNLLPV